MIFKIFNSFRFSNIYIYKYVGGWVGVGMCVKDSFHFDKKKISVYIHININVKIFPVKEHI